MCRPDPGPRTLEPRRNASHPRHRRPAERRQVHALQPPGPDAAGDHPRRRGDDARPRRVRRPAAGGRGRGARGHRRLRARQRGADPRDGAGAGADGGVRSGRGRPPGGRVGRPGARGRRDRRPASPHRPAGRGRGQQGRPAGRRPRPGRVRRSGLPRGHDLGRARGRDRRPVGRARARPPPAAGGGRDGRSRALGRDRGPAERRQVLPPQPAAGRGAGARLGDPGHHPRLGGHPAGARDALGAPDRHRGDPAQGADRPGSRRCCRC